jgi:glycerophosphoryl diester phosphodiesterase
MKKRILKYFIGLVLLIAGVYTLLYFLAEPIADHSYFNPDRFMVIAHRGGRSLGPESTVYTFQKAVDLGVDVIEIDIRSTKNGKLVIIHDSTVDSTTNGTGPVNRFSLKELKRLDAGYRWSPDGGRTYPLRGKGLAIPSLDEVFMAFPKMRINIEIKEPEHEIPALLCDLIREHQKVEHVMIASFDASQLKRFRSQCPLVATSVAAREAVLFYGLQWAYLDNIYSPPAQAMQVPDRYGSTRVITHRFLKAAHARNMRVHVWTVNDTEQMRQLINLGVDGIMTDYPQRLLRLLERSRKSSK